MHKKYLNQVTTSDVETEFGYSKLWYSTRCLTRISPTRNSIHVTWDLLCTLSLPRHSQGSCCCDRGLSVFTLVAG